LRSRTRVRVAIPDGQHRQQMLTCALFRNLDFNDSAPLKEYAMDEWPGVKLKELGMSCGFY
jgi:hypothetical protein